MELLWTIGGGILLLGVIVWLYTIITDPARISEEKDAEVERATPAQRRRFLSRFRRPTNKEIAAQMEEQGMSEFSDSTDTGSDGYTDND